MPLAQCCRGKNTIIIYYLSSYLFKNNAKIYQNTFGEGVKKGNDDDAADRVKKYHNVAAEGIKKNQNNAGDDLETVLQQKRGVEWENAKLNLAHTAFDDVTPEVTDAGDPVDTGITGDPAEVEEK